MAEASTILATKKYAVVTGANKGIGLETCRQLASNGIFVVLTARDERRGIEAVEKLKKSGGFSKNDIEFHQLDVTDPASIASLTDFIRSKFGKLDILVNNAGVTGALIDMEALTAFKFDEAIEHFVYTNSPTDPKSIDFGKISVQTSESAEQGLKTNYCGVKSVTEALIPLLQLSDSRTIVNVSSLLGQLKLIPGEWIKTILNDIDNLTEERIDGLLNMFLEDCKQGSHAEKGWPSFFPAYTVSKAALNAYTRLLAKRYPSMVINCLDPGYVKTDINFNTGDLPVEEGAGRVVRLALLPNDGPSGAFFVRNEESSFLSINS